MLTEAEAKAVISAYGIPVPEILVAQTDDEIAAVATHLLATAPALVVKLLSTTISHKSDVGGVVLDVPDAASAVAAARGIRERLAKTAPDAVLDGFALQPMIRRPHSRELIIGINHDPSFGPTILFGAGGTAVEVVDDIATGLVPLDDVLAGDLINLTRVDKLLRGYRDEAPADRAAIVGALLALSQLAVDFPAILSIDVNPLLADAEGVIALDARIEIDPMRVGIPGPNPDLALRPYPSGWERTVEVGARTFRLRPMRPSDAQLYPAFLERVSAEDLRLRFLTPLRTISPEMLIRLTQLDYDRDIAFIALEGASGDLAGIVRYASDPDREAAEFGLLVRGDLQGLGLGTTLMHLLIDYGRAERLKSLDGLILTENSRMTTLCRELGFTLASVASDPVLVRATMNLTP